MLGTLRLTSSAQMRSAITTDYVTMADMFMVAPPALAELVEGLADLEARINEAGSAH